jgi:hypothetical protein
MWEIIDQVGASAPASAKVGLVMVLLQNDNVRWLENVCGACSTSLDTKQPFSPWLHWLPVSSSSQLDDYNTTIGIW